MSTSKTTKVLSIAVAMFAIVGMMGTNSNFAQAASNDTQGVGKGGFQLNLISVNDDVDNKLQNDDNNGHRIFVKEGRTGDVKTKIWLSQGETFAVLDSDGTDGSAEFQLPAPQNESGEDVYLILMRVLGNPHNSVGDYTIVTCGWTDGSDGSIPDGEVQESEISCSNVDSYIVTQDNANGKGKNSKWENVTRELTTVCIDTDPAVSSDGDGITDNDCDIKATIFSAAFEEYLWEVDPNGHKIAQLRFILL